MKNLKLGAVLSAMIVSLTITNQANAEHVGNAVEAATKNVNPTFPLYCPPVPPMGNVLKGIKEALGDGKAQVEQENLKALMRAYGKTMQKGVEGASTIAEKWRSLSKQEFEEFLNKESSPNLKPTIEDIAHGITKERALSQLFQEAEMERAMKEKARTIEAQAAEMSKTIEQLIQQKKTAQIDDLKRQIEEMVRKQYRGYLQESHTETQRKLKKLLGGCDDSHSLPDTFYKQKYSNEDTLKKLLEESRKKAPPQSKPHPIVTSWIEEVIIRVLNSPTEG